MQNTATTSMSADVDKSPTVRLPSNFRIAGLAIISATILSIIFVALDRDATGSTPLEIMQSMLQLKSLRQLVHGVAIASVLAYAYGYASLASRLDLKRPLVLAGLTTYLIACVAMIGATILDGFITNDVAARFVNKSPEDVVFAFNLIRFIGIALTDLAKLAWVLQAVASIAWSIVLIGKSRFARAVGFIGLVSSILVLGAVFSSGINMGMFAILGILLAQAIWNLAAGVLLLSKDA